MADNFYYAEGNAPVKSLIHDLVEHITVKADAYKWNLVYPTDITNVKDYAILSTKNLYGDALFYTKLERSGAATPTSAEQTILDKYNASRPYTEAEYDLLVRYAGSLDYGDLFTFELSTLKGDLSSLDETTQDRLNSIIKCRGIDFGGDEIALAHKYLTGAAMTTVEQAEFQGIKDAHALTTQELSEWTVMKAKRKIYSNTIVGILLKQYFDFTLTSAEQGALASYRQSLELTNSEKNTLVRIQGNMDNRNHINVTIGTSVEDSQYMDIDINGNPVQATRKDLVDENSSVIARLAWYKDLDTNIGDWAPVSYWITQNSDSINLVLRGDPGLDNYPYTNFLTSYAYIGAIKPVEDSAYTDDKYNFALTCSSELEPAATEKFGQRTANGVTDVSMIASYSGLPYQPHYPAFYTTNPFMDKCNFQGSRWNLRKHQFSDVTLAHPVDMERGKMQNVLIGDASAIYEGDRLAYKKDTPDMEMYRKFKITAPYSFLNNSANTLYCIAIRIPTAAQE